MLKYLRLYFLSSTYFSPVEIETAPAEIELAPAGNGGHASPKTIEALEFYYGHYDAVQEYILKPGTKQVLGDETQRHCRFCEKCEPEVTFKTLAHALPEALGNKSLFSNYECDQCNHEFGIGIENHLGKWTKALRVLGRIRGKTGLAEVEERGGRGWKIRSHPTEGLKISAYEDNQIFEVDEDAKTVKLRIPVEPYIPLAVLKAFWKIALTLMPEDELVYFSDVRKWVRQKQHTAIGKITINQVFQPGPMPHDLIGLSLLLRKSDDKNLPYSFLVVRFGNLTVQVPVPSTQKDRSGDFEIPFYRYPDLLDPTVYGESKCSVLDLSSPNIHDSPIEITMHGELKATTRP
ncbi:HNH endonuclease [Agrobacterium rosae]|uniref:HNH endonuclease 5 domain-containing protein n=1 Tax=Agrobacterium rosae TaxID=1972867 RepID=A0A1R3U8C6_9HYPH|nr:HNH endonuclease [Agrobacterium rosae]SCX34513.1 hypothetical protein DSM25559_4498 [Agrobacterium rosae]